jgi:hypothetical protein
MNDSMTIYFDLDGTLYNLYGIPNWLERITIDLDPTAYADESDEALLVDMAELHEALYALMNKGYEIGVISWLAGGATLPDGSMGEADAAYSKAVRSVKREWVSKFLPMATEVHVVKYGTPKHRVARNKGIIVDDHAGVREAWTRGAAIDATDNLIESLWRLVEECEE